MKRLKKIDLHVHATKTRGLPRENGENMPIPSELMEMYRVLGIEKGVLLPEINVECAYDTATNREVHEIASEYPETFSWFCNIDPRQGSNSPQTDFSHFLRYYKGLGAKGVGEISANVYFDDPRLLNLFAHCEAFDMRLLRMPCRKAPAGVRARAQTIFSCPYLLISSWCFGARRMCWHSGIVLVRSANLSVEQL